MRIVRTTISVIALWCATVSLAGAVSVYDVIELNRQGYSDEQIVDIVRTTGSVFKLTAQDIPRLKELGVSETVIRVMLESGLADLSGSGSLPNIEMDSPATGTNESAIANPSSYGYTEMNAAAPYRFSLQAGSAGAPGDQQLVYVTMLGAPVLVLGAAGRFGSIEERGTAVVRNLEEAVRLGDGGFRLLQTDDAVQVVYHSVSLRELPVITLDRRDIDAYDERSDRPVTSNVLASYWAALLNDYWAIAVQHRPPSRLVSLHRGAALKLLFEVVHAEDAEQQGHAKMAFEQLPAEKRKHLQGLATAVPEDFNAFPG
jgi:hypothetical protein